VGKQRKRNRRMSKRKDRGGGRNPNSVLPSVHHKLKSAHIEETYPLFAQFPLIEKLKRL